VEIPLSKPTRGWKDNIKIDIKEIIYKVIILSVYRVTLPTASFFELTQASLDRQNKRWKW
jgi:hypothetical protein